MIYKGIRNPSIINNECSKNLLLDEINDVTKMIFKMSEYNVIYLSKWSKVQFKIGNFLNIKILLDNKY